MKNHIIDLYYVTAKAFMASDNYEDAKHYFEKSIEKYDNPYSHEEIGIILFRENKIKEALEHLLIATFICQNKIAKMLYLYDES